jgi:catechol 2,3-dioxygenase-like lactoylglutathione lyase family enzyme
MFKDSHAFSSFSVDDIERAKTFYRDTLGPTVVDDPRGLGLRLAGGGEVFIYPKANRRPATFTVLNFPVDGIERAVAALSAAGVRFEQSDYGYDHGGIGTDDRGGFSEAISFVVNCETQEEIDYYWDRLSDGL